MRNNSYKMRGIAELVRLYRSKSNGDNVVTGDSLNAYEAGHRNNVDGWPSVQVAGLRFLHAVRGRGGGNGVIDGSGHERQPKPPSTKPLSPRRRPSPRSTIKFSLWAKLVAGSIFTLLLAFWTPKWGTLLRIGGEAEVAMKEAEQVAEVVEKVATVVEKVSEEVATQFPVDNKIKEAVLVVEHVSQEAAKDAHILEDFIHKVEEMKNDLDDIDKIVEPIIEKIIDDKAKTTIEKKN